MGILRCCFPGGFCAAMAVLTLDSGAAPDPLDRKMERTQEMKLNSKFPWKKEITTTTFWIGNNRNSYTSTVNFDSAWDTQWFENYGGTDDPGARKGYRPSGFFPTLNPFYVALPFNDRAFPEKAKRLIPWYKRDFVSPRVSICKGKWVAVHFKGKFAFGTWEDVGPFRTDHAEYVFGKARPGGPTGAGLDVSPALRDYLGLSGKDRCDWRFVESWEVPYGPWIEYGEQALVLSLVKGYKRQGKKLPPGAAGFKPGG